MIGSGDRRSERVEEDVIRVPFTVVMCTLDLLERACCFLPRNVVFRVYAMCKHAPANSIAYLAFVTTTH